MNIKMQCCGIILLMVVLYFYVCRKKIKLITARAFMRIFWITLLSLNLDILSIFFLTHHDIFSEILIDIVCKIYISTLVLTALAAFLYICTDIYGVDRQYRRKYMAGVTIAAVGIVLIFALPIYKSWETPGQIYTYGPSAITTYVFVMFFLAWIVTLLIFQRGKIDSRRWDAMCTWMVCWLGAAGIQFLFNELLLVGFASTIGIIIIYLKLENPELNIDKSTGMFNQEGMLLYTDQLHRSGKEFAVIALVMPESLFAHSAVEEHKIVRLEVVSYLLDIQDAYAFKNKEDEAVLIFEDKEKADKYCALLKKRFESGWGKAGNTYINPKWIYMPEGSIAATSEDVMHLIDYARINGMNDMKEDTVIIRSGMRDAMYEEKNVEILIMEALEHDRIEVFYQPIYSTKEKRFTSAEALVRIRDGEGKLVAPGIFIDVAERNGSIVKLGQVVFEKVCRFLQDNKPEQYGLKYIEVNLSVVQGAYEHLAESYMYIMKKYQIPPEWINLEITESASIETKKVLLDNMKALIDYGVKFSLDDFGTGQSNLNYIVEMPVDIVKFDRSMTASYFENGKAKYVMDAAMRMIHGMELKIVSEGIETEEQFETMKQLGISYIQGYYFSKPLSELEFISFINQKCDYFKQAYT